MEVYDAIPIQQQHLDLHAVDPYQTNNKHITDIRCSDSPFQQQQPYQPQSAYINNRSTSSHHHHRSNTGIYATLPTCLHTQQPHNNNEYQTKLNNNQYQQQQQQTSSNVNAPTPVPLSSRSDSGLNSGDIINNKWLLLHRLGRGAFGDIFAAKPLSYTATDYHGQLYPRRVAIKVEKIPIPPTNNNPASVNHNNEGAGSAAAAAAAAATNQRAVLKLEAIVLKSMQKYDCACRLIEYGKSYEYQCAYLVMSLTGENLLKLRKRRLNGRFTLPTVLRFGMQAIRAIQHIHEQGYIHRDIKPSNFVIGLDSSNMMSQISGDQLSPNERNMGMNMTAGNQSSEGAKQIYLIDFGLARAYRDRLTGEVLPSRGTIAGFRGTPRYASIHVHRNYDLGRRDDLWSLFYMLVEFLSGDLPWGNKRDKEEIGLVKEQYMNAKLLKNTSSCLWPFMKSLMSLKFHTKPDYDYLIQLLSDKYASLNLPYDYPYDWEDTSLMTTEQMTTLQTAPSTVNTQNIMPTDILCGDTKGQPTNAFASPSKTLIPLDHVKRCDNEPVAMQNIHHIDINSGENNMNTEGDERERHRRSASNPYQSNVQANANERTIGKQPLATLSQLGNQPHSSASVITAVPLNQNPHQHQRHHSDYNSNNQTHLKRNSMTVQGEESQSQLQLLGPQPSASNSASAFPHLDNNHFQTANLFSMHPAPSPSYMATTIYASSPAHQQEEAQHGHGHEQAQGHGTPHSYERRRSQSVSYIPTTSADMHQQQQHHLPPQHSPSYHPFAKPIIIQHNSERLTLQPYQMQQHHQGYTTTEQPSNTLAVGGIISAPSSSIQLHRPHSFGNGSSSPGSIEAATPAVDSHMRNMENENENETAHLNEEKHDNNSNSRETSDNMNMNGMMIDNDNDNDANHTSSSIQHPPPRVTQRHQPMSPPSPPSQEVELTAEDDEQQRHQPPHYTAAIIPSQGASDQGILYNNTHRINDSSSSTVVSRHTSPSSSSSTNPSIHNSNASSPTSQLRQTLFHPLDAIRSDQQPAHPQQLQGHGNGQEQPLQPQTATNVLPHAVIQPHPPSAPAPSFSHISRSFGRFAKRCLAPNKGASDYINLPLSNKQRPMSNVDASDDNSNTVN